MLPIQKKQKMSLRSRKQYILREEFILGHKDMTWRRAFNRQARKRNKHSKEKNKYTHVNKTSNPHIMNNVYGEPLATCQNRHGDTLGSWDAKGYCSDRGIHDPGVHQICFRLTPDRSSFSSDTFQSEWSEERIGNNHCMCLGPSTRRGSAEVTFPKQRMILSVKRFRNPH